MEEFLKFLLLALSLFFTMTYAPAQETILRKIGDLMYMPKKGQFLNTFKFQYQDGQIDREYDDTTLLFPNERGMKTDEYSRYQTTNTLEYGLGKNFSMGLTLGYEFNELDNQRIPTYYFNSYPFNEEIQLDEENQGILDPIIHAKLRAIRQSEKGITLDLKANILMGFMRAERSTGYYRGSGGTATVRIADYQPINTAVTNSSSVETGNVAEGGVVIGMGAELGKKFSPQIDGKIVWDIKYHLEKEVNFLRGDATGTIFRDKVRKEDAHFETELSAVGQYRISDFLFYTNIFFNFKPSHDLNSLYETSRINELEKIGEVIRYGGNLGAKWVAIDRRLLLDLSFGISSHNSYQDEITVTSPAVTSNNIPVRYRFTPEIEYTIGLGAQVVF